MKRTIKTKELIEVAKSFIRESEKYKEREMPFLSEYYRTMAMGIETALKVTAVDVDQHFDEGFKGVHKAIWGE